MSGERRGEQQRDEFHQHILINRMGHSKCRSFQTARQGMFNAKQFVLHATGAGALLWPVDYLAGVRADRQRRLSSIP